MTPGAKPRPEPESSPTAPKPTGQITDEAVNSRISSGLGIKANDWILLGGKLYQVLGFYRTDSKQNPFTVKLRRYYGQGRQTRTMIVNRNHDQFGDVEVIDQPEDIQTFVGNLR